MPADLSKVRTISIKTRPSNVAKGDMASAPRKGASFRSFEAGLPGILAVKEIRFLADAIPGQPGREKPCFG
jgi:hypothetical protein